MLDYNLKQIELSKNYGFTEWREDIKSVLTEGGCGENPFVFLFSDTQVKDERFILDISSILNTGEVPNIFAVDEKMAIIDRMRVHAKALKNGKNMSANDLFEFFTKLRDNLHIVLAFSQLETHFDHVCGNFPRLLTAVQSIGFLQPTDALKQLRANFASIQLMKSQSFPGNNLRIYSYKLKKTFRILLQ